MNRAAESETAEEPAVIERPQQPAQQQQQE